MTATARSRTTPPVLAGSGKVEECSPTTGRRAGIASRADPVRRSLGLRRVHRPRHPGRRRLRRRRGRQDGGAGAIYGGAAGEQYDPCYHEFCDRLSSILDTPPTDVLADAANAAKMQGGGERSMRQFLPSMTHAVWHFAKDKNPLPPRATSARASRKLQAQMTRRSSGFKFRVTSWRARARGPAKRRAGGRPSRPSSSLLRALRTPDSPRSVRRLGRLEPDQVAVVGVGDERRRAQIRPPPRGSRNRSGRRS